MTWAAIVANALKLFNALATCFNNKQLMDAGRSDAQAKFTGETLRKVQKANTAGIAAKRSDGVPDGFTRD